MKRRFVKCVEWPPSSPDVNPLDYFFWDLVKTKVYQGRAGEPFSSEEELKTNEFKARFFGPPGMSFRRRFVSLKLCVGFSIFDSASFLLNFIFLFNKMHGLSL